MILNTIAVNSTTGKTTKNRRRFTKNDFGGRSMPTRRQKYFELVNEFNRQAVLVYQNSGIMYHYYVEEYYLDEI